MRVKRLEVQGFKSFKDRTVIHFDQPITGIVGPNGCGKSNIVDAFFWVMGDQSNKHMRAADSSDLIFNGGAKYSPMGMAEATLVLETDLQPDLENAPTGASSADVPAHLRGKEVSVTRRVYREGEGEYFINGIQSRLRDIQELFMDTGIGSKGYSVIKQGEIDKVVNSKPDDRRVLVEEAAGIAKYKARKKESQRKMEAAEGNLSRIRDVLAEMERTLGSLERQAQKARRYKELRQELIEKETSWARKRLRVIERELTTLEGKRTLAEEEMLASRARAQTLENDAERIRIALASDQNESDSLSARLQEIQSEKVREEGALEISRSRQKDFDARIAEMNREKAELTEWIALERQTLADKERLFTEAEASWKETQALSRAEESLLASLREETSQLRAEMARVQTEVLEDVSRSSGLRSKLAALDAKIESARARLTRAETAEKDAALKTQESEGLRANLETSAATASETRQGASLALTAKQEEQKSLERSLKEAERSREESLSSLSRLRSKLESLRELAAAHEGMGDGPKKILEWARDSGKGASFEVLADALQVKPGFEKAVEGMLESRLEDLVSYDPLSALESLSELSRSGAGRARVRIDEAQSSSESSSTPSLESIRMAGIEAQGFLLDFVELAHDKKGASWLGKLLRPAIVVETLSPVLEALANGSLSPELRASTWVTLEGFVLDGDGSLRGGSTISDQAGSLLGRKRLIAELEIKAGDAERTHADRETIVSELRTRLESARSERDTLEMELREAEVRAVTAKREAQEALRSLEQAMKAIEVAEAERTAASGEIESAVSERKNAEQEIEGILGRESELKIRLDSTKTSLFGAETRLSEREQSVQALQSRERDLQEAFASLRHDWDLSRSLIEEREKRVREIDATLASVASERTAQSQGDGRLEDRIRELIQSIASEHTALSQIRDRMEQAHDAIRVSLEESKSLSQSAQEKLSIVNEALIRKAGLEADLQNLRGNIEEKYGPGVLEAAPTEGSSESQGEMEDPVVTSEISAEEEQLLRTEVEDLHDRIRRLGDVNPGAVDEYDDHQKRFLSLDAERLDLEKSIEDLKEAIEHINKTSEVRFQTAFDAIDQRFRKLFPIIFGGGSASLALVYPEGSTDILDAGVDIMASPPGKKVQNIALLSGGEKALTALSLVFAIFLVKPSPFCLLDEVDAPLDDSNVGKFNALLKEMSARTQFILITHNKKTMELNDSLYGVTMEEPGVSKMVSIRIG